MAGAAPHGRGGRLDRRRSPCYLGIPWSVQTPNGSFRRVELPATWRLALGLHPGGGASPFEVPMPLNWSDERYVRLYTRDTPQWQCLSFLAQGLFCLLLRKVDRAGVLPLGRMGRKAVFVSVGHAHQAAMLDPALDELLADGCVEIRGDDLVVPNFIEAQEAEASDKARARASRERRRAGVTGKRHEQNHVTQTSQNVTVESHSVTGCHGNAPLGNSCDVCVTPSQPSQADPIQPNCAEPAKPADGCLAGEPEWLVDVRRRLAVILGMPKPLGVGRNPEEVVRSFTRIRDGWGHEALVREAATAAMENRVVPANLSWWVGWFDRVPDASLREGASRA